MKVPRASKNLNKMKRNKKKLVKNVTPVNESTSSDDIKPDATASKVRLIQQELKFAKILAGNNTKLGEKQLKSLKKWLKLRSNSSFRKYLLQLFIINIII